MGYKALLVEVTVFDDDTGDVVKKTMKHYSGMDGYDVERMFREMGEAAAKEIDPRYNESSD